MKRQGYRVVTVAEKKSGKQEVIKGAGIFIPYPPRLLSLKNAAIYMGRTVWGMRELYWSSRIPAVLDGKKIFFDLKDLDAYIQNHKATYGGF